MSSNRSTQRAVLSFLAGVGVYLSAILAIEWGLITAADARSTVVNIGNTVVGLGGFVLLAYLVFRTDTAPVDSNLVLDYEDELDQPEPESPPASWPRVTKKVIFATLGGLLSALMEEEATRPLWLFGLRTLAVMFVLYLVLALIERFTSWRTGEF